jgi:nitrogen fixation protein NifB
MNGYAEREQWKDDVAAFIEKQNQAQEIKKMARGSFLVALCSKGMGIVNQHFGHATEFQIYRVVDGVASFINVRKVHSNYCEGPSTCGDGDTLLPAIIETIADCDAVVAVQVGYGPHKALEAAGVLPVTDAAYSPLGEAALHAAGAVVERAKAGKWKIDTATAVGEGGAV